VHSVYIFKLLIYIPNYISKLYNLLSLIN